MKDRTIAFLLHGMLIIGSIVAVVPPVFSFHFEKILPILEKGDWIFRRGPSVDSNVIMLLGGGHFSHMGVVIETKPNILVVHATIDDDPNRANQVIVSTLQQFLRSELATDLAITRPDFLTNSQKKKVVQRLKQQVGKPFVLNIRSRVHRYCTTIVEEAIKTVYPAFSPEWQTINTPFFQGSYLFPEAFFGYPDNRLIYFERID